MREKPTKGYPDRVRHALDYGPRPMSVMALSEELSERFPDLRGTSYGGVRLYAESNPDKNPRNPRIELLRAMAEVLEVQPDWLAFGDGGMTEAEDRRERVTTGAVRALLDSGALRVDGRDEALRGFMSVVAVTDDFPDLPQAAKDIITRFLWDVCTEHPGWFAEPVPAEEGAPEYREFDEGRLSEFAKRFFPDRIRGSYGEQMAQVLAHAQVAYLTTFGSQLDNEEE